MVADNIDTCFLPAASESVRGIKVGLGLKLAGAHDSQFYLPHSQSPLHTRTSGGKEPGLVRDTAYDLRSISSIFAVVGLHCLTI